MPHPPRTVRIEAPAVAGPGSARWPGASDLTARRRLRAALIEAYGGDTYQLLTDIADHIGASVAYVDRPTVEAHLERPLSDGEWSRAATRFKAMDFDDLVGDAGTLRTDWIESVLLRAGVPGRARTDEHRGDTPSRSTLP